MSMSPVLVPKKKDTHTPKEERDNIRRNCYVRKGTTALERIFYLEEEAINKMEASKRKTVVQLIIENMKLDYGNKRAEANKIDSLTKRFTELETRLLRVEEENST